jgi:ATP-dependent Clp protease ATP-binding subunit ClpB
MTIENFTTSSQELINKAAQIAKEYNNPALLPLHLLAAGLENEFCRSFFDVLQVPLEQLEALVEAELKKLPHVQGAQLGIDYAAEHFFNALQKEADRLGDHYISLEHFLLGWATTNYLQQSIQDFFKRTNFTHAKILAHMQSLRRGKTVKEKNADKVPFSRAS